MKTCKARIEAKSFAYAQKGKASMGWDKLGMKME